MNPPKLPGMPLSSHRSVKPFALASSTKSWKFFPASTLTCNSSLALFNSSPFTGEGRWGCEREQLHLTFPNLGIKTRPRKPLSEKIVFDPFPKITFGHFSSMVLAQVSARSAASSISQTSSAVPPIP